VPTVSRAVVQSVRVHADDVREFRLLPDKRAPFEAGQFLQLTLGTVTASDFWPESRTFSIASFQAPDRTLRLFIKRAGAYTSRIFEELVPGAACTVKYAYGEFTMPAFEEDSAIVCVAGGTGVAPFLAFFDQLQAQGRLDRLTLFHSVRTLSEAVDRERLEDALGPDRYRVFLTRETRPGATCRRLAAPDLLSERSDDPGRHFYLCGSPAFSASFRDLLEAAGEKNVHTEDW